MTWKQLLLGSMLAASVAGVLPAGAPAATIATDFRASFYSQDLVGDAARATLHAADLNSDGRPDVVVVREFLDPVRTFLLQDDGSFLPGPESPLGDGGGFSSYPRKLADISGDGIADLVTIVSYMGGNGIVANEGDGAGGFGGVRTLVQPDHYPEEVAFGEFTGDDLPDLAVARRVGSEYYVFDLAIYAGTPSGGFLFQTLYTGVFQFGSGRYFSAGDVTGDGLDDIVWGFDTGLKILQGKAGGGLDELPLMPLSEQPGPVGRGDFNGDGRADLAVVSTGSSGVWIAYGGNAGKFGVPKFVATVVRPTRIEVADITGTGRDVLLYAQGSGVYEQPIDGSGVAAAHFVRSRGPVVEFQSSDFDGDGKGDLVMINSLRTFEHLFTLSVSLKANDEEVPNGETATASGPGSIVVGDLDRDGRVDAVTTSAATDLLTILWGNGDGGFSARTDVPTGDGPQAVVIGFLDNDVWPDLIVTNEAGASLAVHRGLGARSFGAPTMIPGTPHPRGAALGDLDADGLPDVAVALDNLNKVALLHGDGAGGLSAPLLMPSGSAPCAPIIADIDRDGRPDLVYGLRIQNAVAVRYGLPGGGLAPEVLGPGALGLTKLALLDVNRDGQLDIASFGLNGAPNYCTLAAANGSGGFSFYSRTTISGMWSFTSADFDGDGYGDLALGSSSPALAFESSVVGIVDGFAPANSPVSQPLWGAIPQMTAMAAGDMNGDGGPDLVFASAGRSTVGVVLNRRAAPVLDASGPAPSARPGILFAGPNPTRGAFSVRYVAPRDMTGSLAIVTLRGSVVERHGLDAGPAGERTVRVTPRAALAPGVYWVDVRQGAFHDARKLVVVP